MTFLKLTLFESSIFTNRFCIFASLYFIKDFFDYLNNKGLFEVKNKFCCYIQLKLSAKKKKETKKYLERQKKRWFYNCAVDWLLTQKTMMIGLEKNQKNQKNFCKKAMSSCWILLINTKIQFFFFFSDTVRSQFVVIQL